MAVDEKMNFKTYQNLKNYTKKSKYVSVPKYELDKQLVGGYWHIVIMFVLRKKFSENLKKEIFKNNIQAVVHIIIYVTTYNRLKLGELCPEWRWWYIRALWSYQLLAQSASYAGHFHVLSFGGF